MHSQRQIEFLTTVSSSLDLSFCINSKGERNVIIIIIIKSCVVYKWRETGDGPIVIVLELLDVWCCCVAAVAALRGGVYSGPLRTISIVRECEKKNNNNKEHYCITHNQRIIIKSNNNFTPLFVYIISCNTYTYCKNDTVP